MKKISVFLGSLLFTALTHAQHTPHFASYPSLSPDASEVYFTYDSDIWKVPTKGGAAMRVTALEGEEKKPMVSPDGKWVAFTSNPYGNDDIFLLSIETGVITQLTFHQAADQMESWSWDSKTIYFTSNRYNSFGSYAVSVEGGTAKPLFSNFFATSDGLVETPDGAYLFTNSMESNRQVARKRYKGANNPDILYYNPETEEYKRLTTYIGKDFNPTLDQKGNTYYISDENTGEYNLYELKDGTPKALTAFEHSIKTPHVAANGEKIVFEKEYQLYLYDVQTKQVNKINYTAPSHYNLDKKESFKTKDISYFDMSPDGNKIAFVSRGVLFVSDKEGDFITEILNNGERVMEVKWLDNNQDLLFSMTSKGYPNWYKVSAKGGALKKLTDDLASNRNIAFNPEYTQAVYLSGREEVRLLDLKTEKSRTIVTDEIWGFQNSAPSFSPDGKYVLFTAMRDFEQDIFIHHIAENKTINLTNTGVSETAPSWSPDGKYIYFASNRTTPSYPFGMKDASIYRLALDWYADDFTTEGYEKLFEEKEETKKDKKNKETKEAKPIVKVNVNNLRDRIEQVSKNFGTQSNPKAFTDGERTIVFYTSNEESGAYKLYKKVYEAFKKPVTKKVTDGRASQIIQTDKKAYYIHTNKGVFSYNEANNKLDKIDFAFNFQKNLEQEFQQMFEETWAGIDENFYEENFHGMDWSALKDTYQSYLPYVGNRANLRVLLNDMLGELNASHLGFNSNGKEEKTRLQYYTNETGLLFDAEKPYEVSRIVPKSPAVASHITVEPGDKLVAVNGEAIDESKDRDSYFTTSDRKKELQLTFERNGKSFEVNIKTISDVKLRDLLYDEWIATNREKVKKWSEDRIAYTYMKNMTDPQLESFLLDMVAEANNREGLILDLRFNTGGNVHDKVLNFLAQRPYLQWKYRGGKKTTQANFGPSAGPIVLLVNQASLSDAEMTAAGFKELGLGTIIGTETYRWIIFTSAKGLVDNSSYRVPAWGTYTLDGENLEHTGVSPDIEVKNTFLDNAKGEDPQLERAIKEILQQL